MILLRKRKQKQKQKQKMVLDLCLLNPYKYQTKVTKLKYIFENLLDIYTPNYTSIVQAITRASCTVSDVSVNRFLCLCYISQLYDTSYVKAIFSNLEYWDKGAGLWSNIPKYTYYSLVGDLELDWQILQIEIFQSENCDWISEMVMESRLVDKSVWFPRFYPFFLKIRTIK